MSLLLLITVESNQIIDNRALSLTSIYMARFKFGACSVHSNVRCSLATLIGCAPKGGPRPLAGYDEPLLATWKCETTPIGSSSTPLLLLLLQHHSATYYFLVPTTSYCCWLGRRSSSIVLLLLLALRNKSDSPCYLLLRLLLERSLNPRSRTKRETENLVVFFNIYCWAKKTSTDTQDMDFEICSTFQRGPKPHLEYNITSYPNLMLAESDCSPFRAFVTMSQRLKDDYAKEVVSQQTYLENRICDGLMDCHDFSDEMACDYCPYGMVHCGVGAACIEGVKRCDGTPDCPNGSDERGCLTVAPDMEAANFVHQYFQDGFVISTEGNKTGKICADVLTSANFTSAKRNSFLEAFGESACRSMSYRTMDLIEVRTDNERSSEYAHIKDSSQLKASFSKDPCNRRQVLYLSCSELECGVRPVHMHPDRPSRGLNVLPASHGDWPWMAALFRDGVHVCDATLVAEKWLITSASCFEGQGRAHWVARFAAVRLSSDAPWEQERRVVGMVKSPVDSSNLVLVKLSSPVIYSDFVRPVCLARDKQTWMTPTSRCVSLGWGKDGDNLHEATTRIIVNENCNNTVQVCAELASVKDACRNVEVTGGPLLCQEVEDGAWSLVGIAKENYHCDALTFEVNRLYDGIIPLSTWIVQTVRQT
nr:EOG090X019S [Eulimnadia texana]